MLESSLLREIQLTYNQLTKTEKKIADYVMNHANEILFMSITDLADSCKVADASVHRFCRTIGIKGYQEFKMKLSLSIGTTRMQEKLENHHECLENPLELEMKNILQNSISVLEETRKILEVNELEKTIHLIENSKNVYFLGIGDSLLSAKEARNKFLRVTNKVSYIEDPHMQAMVASMANEGDLFIVISYSGSTKDNIYVANIAHNAGAKVVVISRFKKSPLATYADVLLLCGSNEGPLDGGSLGTKMSQLYIIDVLYKEYYRRNIEVAQINKEKTSHAIVEKLF